jgi:hypothetical protein
MQLSLHHVTKCEVASIKQSQTVDGMVYFVATIKIKHLPFGSKYEQEAELVMFADNADAFADLATRKDNVLEGATV